MDTNQIKSELAKLHAKVVTLTNAANLAIRTADTSYIPSLGDDLNELARDISALGDSLDGDAGGGATQSGNLEPASQTSGSDPQTPPGAETLVPEVPAETPEPPTPADVPPAPETAPEPAAPVDGTDPQA